MHGDSGLYRRGETGLTIEISLADLQSLAKKEKLWGELHVRFENGEIVLIRQDWTYKPSDFYKLLA